MAHLYYNKNKIFYNTTYIHYWSVYFTKKMYVNCLKKLN